VSPVAESARRAPTLHVEPDAAGRWSVRREGDPAPLSRHTNATAAQLAARALAGQDGRIVTRDRYGRVHEQMNRI
jgi:hypothetical protein